MLLHILFFLFLTLGRFGEGRGPFLFLLDLPKTFVTLLMRGTITPKMEINIKHRSDNTTKLVDLEAHIFGENRESKVVCAQELNMEIQRTTTKTRL
jgi:hypothetical protein